MIRPDGMSVRQAAVWTRLDSLVHVFTSSRLTPQVASLTHGAGDSLH